ncbi:MAG: hypothetical protein KF861_13250 [Planctomycetaceae bacterium]|nr:hypothetical protein [Planctomycetaceae bacterium]
MLYCSQWLGGLSICLFSISSLAAQTITPQVSSELRPLPAAADVENATVRYLAGLSGREEDDLLSRGDVAPLFDVLRAIGWEMDKSSQDDIKRRLLEDSDWLVRTLRTTKGTRFMRDMSQYPQGYDRIDRMRQQPHGKQELQGLINTPGGAKLIEYLTTTKEGKQTGAHTKGGRGMFNTPTDRLYTQDDVVKQVQAAYAAELARREKASRAASIAP